MFEKSRLYELRRSFLGTNALLASFVTLSVFAACRKAEPDELVTRPRPADNSSSATGGLGSGNSSATGGTGSRAPTSGAGGTAGTDTGAGGSSPEPEPVVACNTSVNESEGPFTKQKFLEAAADCASATYCQFSRDAQRLRDRTASAVASTENKARAQAAWAVAMATWEEAEFFRFGPAAKSADIGGQDLRDLIYSWPAEVRCKVDEQTVSRFYASAVFSAGPKDSFIAGRSLAATEYLLFYEGADNGCTQFSSINAKKTWAALSPDELRARKAEYAAATANDVLASAVTLVNAWRAGDSGFRSELLRAGNGSTLFTTEQVALNTVAQALFYLDKEVKDLKLAIPLGLDTACPSTSCPDRFESRYAKLSTENLRANLRGFRKLFQGCGAGNAGIGVDDWLSAVGKPDLAQSMLTALSDAEASIDNLGGAIEPTLVSHPERVRAVYDAIKRITDPLKTEVVTALNIELPRGSETDND